MTDAPRLPETKAAALIADIERQVGTEVDALIESAEQEAARLIAQAFRLARTRAAEAISALRRDGARRLAEVEAQIETQERIAGQALAAKALDKALPLLAKALDERWQDEAARDAWSIATARYARERLRGGTARVEHPPLWDAATQSRFLAALDAKLDAPDFMLDADPERRPADQDRGRACRRDAGRPHVRCHDGARDAACRNQRGPKHHFSRSAGRPAVSEAEISWIGGPVLHARVRGPFVIGEALEVGPARLPGEVIRLKGEELVAQVYEDTTGLRPGIRVAGTGRPLSVPLGPGLLGHIFDGLLRPLESHRAAGAAEFGFHPLVAAGETLAAGAAFATILGPGPRQSVLLPPDVGGTLERIVPEGIYPIAASLCTIRTAAGQDHDIGFVQHWPVRRPRPVAERLPLDQPMITGQRILDVLFPIARGGRAVLPGGFGTGKTILQETLAKWCDADVIVYVGCGERGNEMAEVLHEFPSLTDPRTGRPLMERTIIIANTSDKPVAAREASIYTAASVGEYFRDQGLHVALMADSTSRWAEALREVSGRLGELPGEAGYPAYLGSRLAEFYERAARVTTLAGTQASLTIIGAVSPSAGDFSEPVTTHTKRYARCFWGLDRERAQARFYPAINPLLSYSEEASRFCILVGRTRQSRLVHSARPIADPARSPGQSRAYGPHRRQGCPAAAAAAHPDLRRPRQRSLPAPVGLLARRSLLLARTPDSHAEPHSALHRSRGWCARGRGEPASDHGTRRSCDGCSAWARTSAKAHLAVLPSSARRSTATWPR